MLFKKNDKVLLISSDRAPFYDRPVVGTKYGCEGRIVGFQYANDRIIVRWNNGYHNAHKSTSLLFVKTSSKRCKSIW